MAGEGDERKDKPTGGDQGEPAGGERGFKVADRRRFAPDGTPLGEDAAAPEARPAPGTRSVKDEAPEARPATEAKPAPGAKAAAGARRAKDAAPGHRTLAPIDFGTLILSLGTSALIHMGEAGEPGEEAPRPNLTLAQQSIDLLAVLQDKTKGNLTPEEEELLRSLLYDLRMKFVAARGKRP
ncbi:MAG TPA: DUF1844 domain-containing protein [Myxococcota bacterium]|jgi:hypothetical protein|nr:DUF1844 domain-containing protein [Myxococcota bacterium]